jgi:hypothetical protein
MPSTKRYSVGHRSSANFRRLRRSAHSIQPKEKFDICPRRVREERPQLARQSEGA